MTSPLLALWSRTVWIRSRIRSSSICTIRIAGFVLGSGWSKGGHDILYGEPQPEEKTKELKAAQPNAVIVLNGDAARYAEVVALCTPWSTTEAAIRDCGSLAGKIVIDVTNPLKANFSGLDRGFITSGGEQVAQWATG